MKRLKTQFLVWLMQNEVYLFLLRYILPNLRFLQPPGPSYFYKQRIRDNMQAGDILLSKSKFALTNVLIGGDFSHGAVVIGPDEIAEMTANDFDVVDVDHFCHGTTRIALLRIVDQENDYGKQVALKAMSFVGVRYDASFKLGVEALYCSELCYQADFERRMQADLTDLVDMGRPYISPSGLYKAKGLELVYEWKDDPWS